MDLTNDLDHGLQPALKCVCLMSCSGVSLVAKALVFGH